MNHARFFPLRPRIALGRNRLVWLQAPSPPFVPVQFAYLTAIQLYDSGLRATVTTRWVGYYQTQVSGMRLVSNEALCPED